jgi:dynein heavy chain
MISAEKEEVDFLRKVDVNEGDKKGNVELWMLDIEREMKRCLQDLAKKALVSYEETKRTDWVK